MPDPKPTLVPMNYKVSVSDGSVFVRSGPGRTFSVVTSLKPDPNKQYQVTGEAHGELINNDDTWVFIPEVNGFVSRAVVQVVFNTTANQAVAPVVAPKVSEAVAPVTSTRQPQPQAKRRVLGLHINNLLDPTELALARSVSPILLHAPWWSDTNPQTYAQALQALRQAVGPNCLITARIGLDDGPTRGDLQQNPQALADRLAATIRAVEAALPAGTVSAWLGLNEVPKELWPQWAVFQERFNSLLAPLPVIAYGFSTGWSPIEVVEWQVLLRGLVAPNCVGIATHEYWNDLNDHTQDSWRQYRFSRSRDCLVQVDANTGNRLKWYITECAYTGSIESGETGWRTVNLPEAEYLRQITQYANQVATYPYVAGAAIFCVDSAETMWATHFGILGVAQIEQILASY